MSKSETTSASNCKVIRDGEAGRRGARWQVTFTLDFLALKGLIIIKCAMYQLMTFQMYCYKLLLIESTQLKGLILVKHSNFERSLEGVYI